MLSATKTPSTSWSELAVLRLRELVDRPVFLVLFLLAANAVARPYCGLTHDARLYSVQVVNRAENGTFDNDLYFRYGSQDRYSVFSFMMTPLVNLLGLKSAFFTVYLGGTVLCITGLVLLVRRLVEDPVLAVLTLLYLVIAPLNYGGHHIFHVHEPFLTPRLLAVGLVLLGLGQLLQARLTAAFALMALAGLLHPLMAAGGFLMWGGVFLIDKLGWRLALAAAASMALAVAAFLATPSLAGRYLGEMDASWRHAILKPTPFNFTTEWEFGDWANVFCCGVGIVGGVWLFGVDGAVQVGNRRRAWFVGVAGLVGLAAVLGTALAENLPYALPFQGQPYRSLWILRVLEVPLCFLLAGRLFRSAKTGLALLAFVPLVFLLNGGQTSWLEWTLPLFFLPIAVLAIRGLEQRPRRPDWLIRSLAVSLVVSELFQGVYREVLCIRCWSVLAGSLDTFDSIQVLLFSFGILPWMVLILGPTAWFLTKGVSIRAVGLACLGICLAVQTAFFVLPNSTYVRENGTRNLPDILFASDFLRQSAAGKMPTIYCPFGRIEYVWLEMRTNSYFDWCQTSGVMFRRQTAMAAEHRALLVGPFEIERFRQYEVFLDQRTKRNIARFFEMGIDDVAAPTVADLARLCKEPDLDYVVVKNEFPGLYSATNGRVYIYDCQKVRAKLHL